MREGAAAEVMVDLLPALRKICCYSLVVSGLSRDSSLQEFAQLLEKQVDEVQEVNLIMEYFNYKV